MGNGKAVRALLVIVAVIAGTLRHSLRSLSPSSCVRAPMRISESTPQCVQFHALVRHGPHHSALMRTQCISNEQAHASVTLPCHVSLPLLQRVSRSRLAAEIPSAPARIATQMTINGRPFSFESRRCVNIPAMPGAVKARVKVSPQQGSDAGNAAACRAIRFFQDPACTGQTLDLLPIIGTQRRWTFSPSWAHRRARHAFYSCSPCFHARFAPMLALLPCSPCS
ncbi:unnamed protein product [Closterium sp. NIES-64]|nr:unnamed protein product [Closterium sp. NIES-64]